MDIESGVYLSVKQNCIIKAFICIVKQLSEYFFHFPLFMIVSLFILSSNPEMISELDCIIFSSLGSWLITLVLKTSKYIIRNKKINLS